MLHQSLLLLRGFHKQPAFANVVGDGLFDIDVFAGVHGQDRGGRVPVVRRGDDDRIDRFVIENFPQVRHRPAGLNAELLNRILPAAFVHIANVSQLDVGRTLTQTGVVNAAIATTDQPDHELVVWSLSGISGHGGKDRGGSDSGC